MDSKWTIWITFLIAFSYRAQSQQLSEQSLSGTWRFLADNSLTEKEVMAMDYAVWDTLQVPGNWDTRARYSEYVGKGYYQRTFTLPEGWNQKQIRLHFDAVYETAKVWLNGEFLGKHVGGYTPFEFNITDKVDASKANSLVVMADNTYKRGAWWAWGGISRDVTLKVNEEVRLVYQYISAEPDFEEEIIRFALKFKLENNGTRDRQVRIDPSIKGVDINPIQAVLPANATAFAQTTFETRLADFKLWDTERPTLYKLETSLVSGENVMDQVVDKFGIRKFEVRGEQFYLNNNPVRMNGVNRVHDHPDFGNTEPDHLVRQDMLDIKYSLGCNFARLMHAPLAENLLDFCDSIGFLLVEEIPVWGADDPQTFPDNPLTKQWLREMVERDFNHPSVVAYSVGNELRDPNVPWPEKVLTTEQFEYIQSMLGYLDILDTTRLKTYVSLTTYRNGAIGNEPYGKVDFISINSYGDALKHAKLTHERFPGKPIFISEIGKAQIGPAPDAELGPELMGYIRALTNLPYVTGVAIWSYNDYRSNYKGTPESGFREWGLVDERRNRKKAYYQYKKLIKSWKE
ncbi:glycoside hydrolase family 2 protein [Marinoscillum furvescens]|uniref:Beta-glucuronidase n=1 Tax=Marinoscillum furvescens DSM 4134 TaxID=1122208 RepID=A0A3D9KZH3_MARFU|nr:glycoside hydrolase family 2 TIM barrel-domain containing protein [Marinoscillum furvescens]RED95958.1 beta-glucuronidase [Marinoscillum furvescens DSM 4134]